MGKHFYWIPLRTQQWRRRHPAWAIAIEGCSCYQHVVSEQEGEKGKGLLWASSLPSLQSPFSFGYFLETPRRRTQGRQSPEVCFFPGYKENRAILKGQMGLTYTRSDPEIPDPLIPEEIYWPREKDEYRWAFIHSLKDNYHHLLGAQVLPIGEIYKVLILTELLPSTRGKQEGEPRRGKGGYNKCM